MSVIATITTYKYRGVVVRSYMLGIKYCAHFRLNKLSDSWFCSSDDYMRCKLLVERYVNDEIKRGLSASVR